MPPDSAGPWSSEEIFAAISEQPFEIETTFSVRADPPHRITGHDEQDIHRVVLKPSDSQTLNIQAKRTTLTSGESSSSHITLARLLVASKVTRLTSRSCIRTIELSLDPTHLTTTLSSSSSSVPSLHSSQLISPPVTISLNSFRANMNLSLIGKTIFANGYQSWSTSFAGADESSVFENPNWLYNELTQLGLASDMHIFRYPGERGKVHSNMVTVIRDKCPDPDREIDPSSAEQKEQDVNWRTRPEQLVLCGSLSEDSGYTYFLMDIRQGRFTVLQDCVGKKLRANGDKLILRTFFAWDCKDKAVWDAYAAEWSSLYKDRRSIRSTIDHQLSGWTSWYCHYENINEHIILENLQHLTGSGLQGHHQQQQGHGHHRLQWPAKVFQIDDGYTVVGDWLTCDRGKFPRGMAFIASVIRDKGLVPGLWLAPFLVSKNSRVVQDHPHWLVRKQDHQSDQHGGQQHRTENNTLSGGLGCCGIGYNDSSPFMLAHPAFSVGAYALNLENPEVQAHLANVFRVVVKDWGFKMLKLDFLFAAAQVPRNNKTRGQLMWEALQMIRTWAGPDTILLGCGVPLGASCMVVDYCRIGCDVGAGWDTMQRHFHDREYISCFNSLTSTLSRWAFSGRFFGNDPDVFFVRDWNMGLSLTERRTLMLLNHILGHLVFCSDPLDLTKMSSDQKQALSLFFPWPSAPDVSTSPFEIMRVLQPMPRQKDVYLIQVHAQDGTIGDHDFRRRLSYIVLANLSRKRQHVGLSVLDTIIARENDIDADIVDCEGKDNTGKAKFCSVYFHASTQQFGSAAAVYPVQPRDTCVFLRVIDSTGQLCGLPTVVPPLGSSESTVHADSPVGDADDVVAVHAQQPQQPLVVHLIATAGGHILPATEVESFRYDARKMQFAVKFRPCFFPKTVTLWLAWKRPSYLSSEHETVAEEEDTKVVKRIQTLNGSTLQHHPRILMGHGISVASCILSI
ncbi:hypothetical protein BGX28_009223 [Mortierella sp. GBA30]|nr:hypothetical protein BGX28_009223 [Mortierella sp. GBA30]